MARPAYPPRAQGLVLSLCMIAILASSIAASAQPTGFDWGISVAVDPNTLDRTAALTPGDEAFVFIVTDRLGDGSPASMRACAFAVVVDPRLEVVARIPTPDALIAANRGVDEWLLGFSDCVNPSQDPFLLMTYRVRLPAGATDIDDLRINVGPLTSTGEPLAYTTCFDDVTQRPLTRSGDAVLNPGTPSIVYFVGAPSVIVEGDDARLAWSAANATTVELDGVPVAPTDQQVVAPIVTTTFELTAGAGATTLSSTALIEVIREPRIVSFTAEPFLQAGVVKARLEWAVLGADLVTLEGYGAVGDRGSRIVDLVDPPLYTLTAQNEWGTSSAIAALDDVEDLPPIIFQLSATPNPFQAGQPVTLNYGIFNGDTASIEPDIGAVDPTGGIIVVHPQVSTDYTLTTTNANGSASQSVFVQLLPARIGEFVAVPSEVFAGRSVVLRWRTGVGLDLDIQPDVGPVPSPMGEIEVTPSADNTTYVLTASNAESSVQAEALVQWLPPEVALTADDTTPYAIDPVTLTATMDGADYASLDPIFGTIDPVNGVYSATISAPTTFVLTAGNAKGESTASVEVIPKIPDATFGASNEEPWPGQLFTLTAEILGAASAVISPFPGAIDPSGGVFELSVSVATTFVLTASNPAGDRVLEVTVVPQMPTVSLSPSTTTPFPGESFDLIAEIGGADSATLEPGFGAIDPGGGIFSTSVVEPTTYILTATNTSGVSVSQTLVTPRAPLIQSFAADPSTLLPEQSTTLSWEVLGADLIEIPAIGLVTTDLAGSVVVSPVGDTTYTLLASNVVGVSEEDAQVLVADFAIRSFTADPMEISFGERSTLSWEVLGEATVSIDGFGFQPMVGSLEVEPPITTTYVLRATNGEITQTRSLLLRVGSPVEGGDMYLSWQIDAIPGEAPRVVPMQPFPVYGLATRPPGGIFGYEFSVHYPPGLIALDRQIYPDEALDVGPGEDNWIVGTGICLQSGNIIPLMAYSFLSLDVETLRNGVVFLGPAAPSSFTPAEPGYVTCGETLFPFDLGPPLRLADTQNDGVPVLSMALEAEAGEDGVHLDWRAPEGVTPESLYLLRGLEEELPEIIAEWEGDAARRITSYLDAGASAGTRYSYRIVAEAEGVGYGSPAVMAMRESAPRVALRSRLLPNVPNPFNPRTEIRYELSAETAVRIDIYDSAGRRLRGVSLPARAPGIYGWVWNGEDDAGSGVSSGIYHVRLRTEAGSDARSISLVR